MINLKLAEYDLETKKFVEFLELGKDFLYGGSYILFTRSSGYFFIDTCGEKYREQFIDEKDPLNRFKGLFDGRTYGDGRFVLMQNFGAIFEDDVLKSRWLGSDLSTVQCQPDEERLYFTSEAVKGNLHENPELYERIED